MKKENLEASLNVDIEPYIQILARITINNEEEIVSCAIGQYDGHSDDNEIFFWFDSISNVIGKHADFEVLDFEIGCEEFGFTHEGNQIINPFLDKTGRFEVNPTIYYQNDYNNHMIKKHSAIFDLQLKHLDCAVSIFETSELYGEDDEDIDESDPYYMLPMYEAIIEDHNGDEIDDTYTGRFCDVESVVEEMRIYVLEVIEKASETVRAKAGEDACFETLETYFDDSKYTYNESIISAEFDPESQSGMLETFGNDYALVRAIVNCTPQKIWSVIDGDDDKVHVVAGLHDDQVPIYYIVTNEDYEIFGESYYLGGV